MATYTATLLSSTSTPLWLTASSAVTDAVRQHGDSLCHRCNRRDTRDDHVALFPSTAARHSGAGRGSHPVVVSTSDEQSWSERGIRIPSKDPALHRVDMILVKGAGIYTPMLAHSLALVSGRAPGLPSYRIAGHADRLLR